MQSGRSVAGGGGGPTGPVSDVRAIFVSDIHLQARPPVARSAEPCWWEAMRRPLAELAAVAEKYQAPILYAGDIFDKWNAGPDVINFAIKHLPPGWAVPGQHDLPGHRYDAIGQSAYWTLCEAGTLTNLRPGRPTRIPTAANLLAYGYPWGHPVRPVRPVANTLRVAVCHSFIWTRGTGYTGAPVGQRCGAYAAALRGYTAAAFGDNHKGFIIHPKGGPAICNCGGFMGRGIDERRYRAGCGLLLGTGRVVRYGWDRSRDKWLTPTAAGEEVAAALGMDDLVESLAGLGAGDALDFLGALRRYCEANGVSPEAQAIINGD